MRARLFAMGLALWAAAPARADEPASSNLHGFVSLAFKNAYITPRGLVVTTKGLTAQPLIGVSLAILTRRGALDELSFAAGAWNDLCSCQHDPFAGSWNEVDLFAGVTVRLIQKLELSLTYYVFVSPPHFFHPEQNLELKVVYDEGAHWGGFSVRPHFRFFYAIAGDSTVVLGARGNTFDVELGMAPGWQLPAARDDGVRFSLPTLLTLGGPGFFGDGGVLGIFSTGPHVSIPLDFIPARWSRWRLDGGMAWIHLFDDNLVAASLELGNRGRRDELVAELELNASF